MKFSSRTQPQSVITPPRMDAATAARWAGGMELLFCGLPLATMGFLFCLLNATFDLLMWAITPMGAGVALWGALRIARADIGDVELTRRAQWCVGFAMGAAALSPFLLWWREMPKNLYFSVNTLLFAATLALLVFAVHRTIAQLCRVVGDAQGARESTSVMWLVFVAWMLPLCAATGFLVRATIEYGEPLGWILRKSLGDVSIGLPRWMFIGTTLTPIVFTCISLMTARKRLLEAAVNFDSKQKSAHENQGADSTEPTTSQITQE